MTVENQDELYLATKALFDFLIRFDDNWSEGWRPTIDVGHVGCRDDADSPMFDILYMSPLGSYVRMRANEHVDQERFHALRELCTTRGLVARRNHHAQYVRENAVTDYA